MIKNKKKISIFLILFSILTVMILCGNIVQSNCDNLVLSTETKIEKFYQYGDIFTVPDANFVSGNSKYKAYSLVYKPDGEVEQLHSFVLDQIGEYKISYSANVNNKIIFDHITFNSDNLSANIFNVGNNAFIQDVASTPDYFIEQRKGIKVTATADGGNVNYSKVLNLSSNTKNDTLLSLAVIPRVKGKEDLWQVNITLTDVYDETNKVRIVTYRGSWSPEFCFTRAAAKGQRLCGYNQDKFLVQTDNRMGTGSRHSFKGINELGFEQLTYSYDYLEKAVYINNCIIADFDDDQFFSTNNWWNGFTTGDVILNVSLGKLESNEADILIYNVNGIDVSNKVCLDFEPPVISIQFGDYDKTNIPKGQVNKQYKIFNATCYDRLQGVIDSSKINRNIFFIDGDIKSLVASNVNEFIPDKKGSYFVEYTCNDIQGNKQSDGYFIEVLEEIPKLNIIDYNIKSKYFVGIPINFPKIVVQGGSGIIHIDMKLKKDNEIIMSNIDTWLPDTEGHFTIDINAIDYLGYDLQKNYDFEVVKSPKPIITPCFIPKYLIDGIAYRFDDFRAIDYMSQSQPIEANKKIFIHDNTGKHQLDLNHEFIPDINNGENIQIELYGENINESDNSSILMPIQIIKAIENGKVDYSKLFIKNNTSVSLGESDLSFHFDKNASIEYINPLIANKFGLSFDVNKNNFNKVEILLSDSQDPNVSIKLSVIKNNPNSTTSKLRVNNDTYDFIVDGSFYDNTTDKITLSYNARNHTIIDDTKGKIITDIRYCLNGDSFQGFPSGKIYLSVLFDGVIGQSCVTFDYISNQTFNSLGEDFTPPVMDLTSAISPQAYIDTEVIIPQIWVSDGVDISAKASVSVYKNKHILLTNDDIARQNLVLKIDSYDAYKIEYTVEDYNGNIFQRTYTIYVQDMIPPTLEVDWTLANAKVGDTHTISQAVASDNNDKNVEIEIFVCNPKGYFNKIEGNKITFSDQGTYEIIYFVKDSAGNYQKQEFEVMVK